MSWDAHVFFWSFVTDECVQGIDSIVKGQSEKINRKTYTMFTKSYTHIK